MDNTKEIFVRMSDIEPFLKSLAKDSTCPLHIAAEIDQILETAPCVDAVEVVRCKDCERFKPGLGADGIMFCKRDKLGRSVFMRNDDFCSYGERKDNEHT